MRIGNFKLRTFLLKTLRFCFKNSFKDYNSKYDPKHKRMRQNVKMPMKENDDFNSITYVFSPNRGGGTGGGLLRKYCLCKVRFKFKLCQLLVSQPATRTLKRAVIKHLVCTDYSAYIIYNPEIDLARCDLSLSCHFK